MTRPRNEPLVDSNVLLDVLTEDPAWARWSSTRLAEPLDAGPVVIDQIVYGEVSLGFSTVEALDAALGPDRFVRAKLPWLAAFLAARAFRAYKRRGGTRTSTLPDFLVGAHAAVLGLALLARDSTRYRTYYPAVRLIAPERE